MKVLHILNELKFSGAEIMLKTAAPEFQNDGFESHILSTGYITGDYTSELESDYTIHHISFEKNLSFLRRLRRLIEDNQFDVIHIHTERFFFIYSLTAYIAKAKKTVRTVHNVFDFTGELQVRKKIQRAIATHLFRVSFISISESVFSNEKDKFNLDTFLIKNWIDEKRFKPFKNELRASIRSKLGIPQNTFLVSSIGACSNQKQHSEIIKAISILEKRNVQLFYVQVGNGELYDDEVALAKDLGVYKNCLFIRHIIETENIYNISDLYLMSSSFEGLGNVCLEAMRCGIPSVLYDVPGLRDLIENNKNGSLIAPNPEALANEIVKYYEDPEMRRRKGEEAFRFVSKNFSMKDSINQLVKLYRG